MDTIKLTKRKIKAGMSSAKGINHQQLKCLGLKWPPRKGWLRRLVGKEIPVADYNRFLELKGKSKFVKKIATPPKENDLDQQLTLRLLRDD